VKRLYPLLFISVFIYWGCEEQDTTPPTVSISSHSSGQTVNEIITITVTTQDNDGISKVEFFIDDSLVLTDTESPYQYEWNTTQYEDFSEHIVKVISYDNSDNSTESQPIMLIVDNRVYLWGEYYSIENTTELDLGGQGLTGSIPPEIGNLTNLTNLSLSSNQLTGSIPPEIGNLTNLTELKLYSNELTGSIPPEIGNLTNLIELRLNYNQLTGIPPEIGNLTNLTYLSLGGNQLTGEIPPEIGNLTNLNFLLLNGNQLTGEIPESICELNIDWSSSWSFNFSNNQLCPPYPSCLVYVGEQDTSDCP
jgi:Leucine-rich repeat (LRR) protein